jgi:hypothetical protein
VGPLPDAVGFVGRSELRARWRALVGLALLVGLVGAVALSAAAGQRRTATALDRFLDATDARDVRVNLEDESEADQLLEALEDELWVAEAAKVATLVFNGGNGEIFTVYASPDAAYQTAVDRPIVVEGRLPLPGSTDEVAIDEAMADQLDLGTGDSVATRLIDPELFSCLLAQTCAPEPAQLLDGDPVELIVTGISRDVDALNGALVTGEASAPQSFHEEWGEDTGQFPPSVVLRFEEGAEDVDQVRDLMEEEDIQGLVIEAETDYLASPQDAIDVQSSSLLVFAVVTGLAGAVATAQAVSRQIGATGNRSAILADLGMTRRARAAAVALPVLGAAVVGAVIAIGLALVASDRFPFAEVRRIEPDPGRRFDAILLVGGLLLVVLVTGAAFWSAWRRAARRVEPGRSRVSATTTWVEGTGAPPSVVAGTRLALSGGPSRTTVPLRSAMVGALLGVTGVLAAGVFGSSLDALVDDPSRWGFNWSATGTALDPTTIEDDVLGLAEEEGIDAIALYRVGLGILDGDEVTMHSLQLPQGRIEHTVLDGDQPEAADEIALGEHTQADLGVEIGDSVVATNADDEEIELEVVGTVALPTFQDREPGEGAVLTYEGWEQATRSEGTVEYVFVFEEGVDRDELEDRLVADHQIGLRDPPLPSRLVNLDDGNEIVTVLLAFFAGLGVVGLLHAMVTSVRRRRRLFATWRAVGFTPGQVRRAVLWQGEVITFVGVLLGLPAGIVVGRLTWQWVIGDLGVFDAPTTPLLLTIAVVPIALAAALLIGAGPAWLAARGRAGPALRDE